MKDKSLKFAAIVSTITKPTKSTLNAIQSWRAVSDSVFLFNTPSDIGGEAPTNVTYITPLTYPCSLREMLVHMASKLSVSMTGVILHEDVFVQPEALKAIEVSKSKMLGNGWAATSKCKEYSPTAYASTGAFTQTGVGNGYQAFITTGAAFDVMAKQCPGGLRAGTPEAYDWLTNFFSTHIQTNRYHDIEAVSPFWSPQRKKEPNKVDTSKPSRGPQRRYI
jgi:hypothetical protein